MKLEEGACGTTGGGVGGTAAGSQANAASTLTKGIPRQGGSQVIEDNQIVRASQGCAPQIHDGGAKLEPVLVQHAHLPSARAGPGVHYIHVRRGIVGVQFQCTRTHRLGLGKRA